MRGSGGCFIDYDIDALRGTGEIHTVETYKLHWGKMTGCFRGGTTLMIDEFCVAGQVAHAGEGDCTGMTVLAGFGGACPISTEHDVPRLLPEFSYELRGGITH